MSNKVRLPGMLAVILAGVFSAGIGNAATAYVTDMLQLDLYADASMTGKPVRKLRSGDGFEVLQRKGRVANVRLPDGQTGWVKSLYIVEEEPARTRLNKLEQRNRELEALVEDLRAEIGARQRRIAELEGDETSTAGKLAAAEAELDALRTANSALENTVSSYRSSVPVSWLVVGVALAFVVGAYGGWYVIDSRSRARHGGYRVY